MPQAPDRLQWAVERLNVQPDQRILEIGCGPGVAAGLVAQRLETGRLTAIDRSVTAIQRAIRRNAVPIAAGQVEFHTCDLAGFDRGHRLFDVVFAMNVNVFWTGPADREWAVLAEILRPRGRLLLFYGYGTGDPTAGRDVTSPIRRAMESRGYAVRLDAIPDGSSVCVAGQLAGP